MMKHFTQRLLCIPALVTLAACAVFSARAGYVPVAVIGYTADIVANGTGPAANSTVNDAEGGYVFMAPDYVNPAGLSSAISLPADGIIYSQVTSGVRFQLAPYTGLNSLRLTTGTSGTLTFPTPQNLSATEIFVLVTSGGAQSQFTATVNFTDGTSQAITGNTVPDWYNGANYAIRGIGRVNKNNDNIEYGSPADYINPRLYEVKLTLAAANYGKQIASILIAHSATGGYINVMGISVNEVTPCAAPASQPTALSITPGNTSTTVNFSASTPAADKYLVVRTQSAVLNTLPVNGTAYTVGATLGNGTVVSISNSTSVADAGLTAGTVYRYTVFAYNDVCTGGPIYKTTAPPSTTASTTSVATGGLVNIPATGWNADIVVDGAGPALSSSSAALDAAGNTLMAASFVSPSGATPTTFMPTSGVVNVAAVPGLSFTLQPYNQNNALRMNAQSDADLLPIVLSGTLTPTTPFSTNLVYLLAIAGEAPAATNPGQMNDTLFFTDGTYQAFTATVTDWFVAGTNEALNGVGRVERGSNTIQNSPVGGGNPRLYYVPLALAPANYNKQIASIGIAKANANNSVIAIMGIAANVLTPCTAPSAQATGLSLTPGATQIQGGFTTAVGSPNKYLVLRTAGTATPSVQPVNGSTYTAGGTLGNATIVSAGAANTFADASLTSATQYTYTVYSYNDACSGGPLYLATTPLSGSATTLGTGGNTYTWTGAVNFTFTNPANWTPARNLPDADDILLFNNGQANAVYGVVSQTVRRIAVSGNTRVFMQPISSTTVTLTLASDGVTATDELSVAAGSTLRFSGSATATSITNTASTLNLVFSGTGGTIGVNGTLEAYNVTATGSTVFNLTGGTISVAVGGVLSTGGFSTTNSFPNSSTSNLIVNGTLRHHYHSTSPPAIPTANYATGSTVLVTGVTTGTTPPAGLNQPFFNFTYDCRSQGTQTNTAVVQNWNGAGPLNVAGTFTVAYTGAIGTTAAASSKLALQTTGLYNHTVNNFSQTGGVFDLGTGAATAPASLNVTGTFNQIGGTFLSSSTATTGNTPNLHFNGTGGTQTAHFLNSPSGPITYRISNPVNITTTNPLFTIFNANNNGGFRISTAAANPVTATGGLVIGFATPTTANTTLTYDAPASVTATQFWLPSNPPTCLTVNTGSSANVVTLPFPLTLQNQLNLTSGDLNIGANTLTLGVSAATPGTLNYTAGFIRTTPGGTFVRWYGTTGLPTSAGPGIGFYPMGYNGLSRAVALSGSSATAITTGGTIGVQHTHANGLVTITPVADGAYSIDTRTNANWSFTTSGVVLGGTLNMALTGGGLFSANNPANLRVMKLASVAGTHVAGSGVMANRSGLTLTDLAQAHYIGANAVDIGGAYIAINTGAWNSPATWDINLVPGSANDAYINPGVTVTAVGTANAAKALNVLPGGTLTVPASTSVTLDSTLLNNGTVNLTGGTLSARGGNNVGILNTGTMTVSGGDLTLGAPATTPFNRAFSQNGTLTVSGGNVTVYGSFSTIAASVINQSGGNISVDGNAGGVLANSVPCGTPIVNLTNAANNFSGGVFTVVDAHACNASTGTNTMVYNNAANIAATGTHVFRMGDGVSTDPGGQTPYNFSVNTSVASTGKFAFNDLVINTGTATNSYFVQGSATMGVTRDLIVNAGGEFRTSSTTATTYVGRHLTVNTGGTLTVPGTVSFANFSSGNALASTNTQVVSGAGTFRNAVSTTPTARFGSIAVNNNGAGGVRFTIGDTRYSGALTFSGGPGRLFMTGGSTLVQIPNATVAGPSQINGWVVGKFQKAAGTGGILHTYPVGDSLYYSPLDINGPTGAVTTAGDIVVSANVPDHPQLGTAGINPGRSVNRWWSIQQLNGLTFSSSVTTTVKPTWNAADVDAGSNTAAFIMGRYAGSAWTLPTPSLPTATSLTGSQTATNLDGDYAVGETCSPIVIGTPPAAQTVCQGSSATFSVTLTSGGGANFQWLKGGFPIPGATTNPYTIPAVALTDAGNYSVTITSGCVGSTPVTSAVAALTVQPAPTVSAQPVSQTKCEGESVTFSVTATNVVSYQWYKGTSPIAGAIGASYTIPSIVLADAGSYTVMMTGNTPCGTFTSQAGVLTVNQLPLTITAASTTTFCTGGSVVLNAATGYTYQWLLNGAPLSGQVSNSYTASATGSYSAIISSSLGCSDTSNAIAVTVGSPPSANITPAGNAAFCAGGTVTLSGPTAGGLAYQWNIGTNPIPGANSATYAANAVGNYTLTVSLVGNAACNSTTATPTVVTQNPLPPATATAAGATSVCQGQTVTLNANAGTGLTYQWNVGTTPVATGGTASSYIANASGSYTVTVTNTSTQCSQTSAPVTVTINTPPPATVTTSGTTTFCQGGQVTLSAPTGTNFSYIWYQGSSAVIPAATGQSYVATQSGGYYVVITNTATNCTQTSATTNVTVNPTANTTVTASGPLALCQGQTVTLSVPTAAGQTYQWRQGTTNIPGATSATYTTGVAGNYTAVVTVAATNCPTTSAVQVVTVTNLPTATATAITATTVCSGTPVNINANGGTGLSYQWRIGGSAIPGATSATYAATATGAYTVTVTNASGCSNTSTAVNVTVNETPTVAVASATPVQFCEGSAVVLNASTSIPVSTYQWRQGTAVIPGANQPFLQVTQGGNYTVSVSTAAPCSATSPPLTVTVYPAPQPIVTFSNGVLSTGFYASYQWYHNGQPIAGATGQTHTPVLVGAYYVRVLDANGCSANSASRYVSSAGVEEKNFGKEVRVYPNPAKDFLYITAPVPVDATLREATGKRLLRINDAKTIDIRNLADGTYILTLTDAAGQVITHQRVVKRGE